MSNEVINSAYRTRLGNSPAKAVLIVLADAADNAGWGFPKVERLVASTELKLRTVRRVLQIFEEIDLVTCQPVEGEFYKYAFQINLKALGTDLKEPFAARFRLAQRQQSILDAAVEEEVVCETASVELFADAVVVKTVCETGKAVCETGKAVCETEPPHPHKGGTIIEPPLNLLVFPGAVLAPPGEERKAKAPIRAKAQTKAKATAPADLRHTLCRLAIVAYAKFKGVVLPWDGSEARALSLLLQSAPELTLQRFQTCLNHRAHSPGTSHGERPRLWLPHITRYQDGPLNQFGKTGDARGNGNFKGKTESSLDAAQQALAVIAGREASGYYEAAGQVGRATTGEARPGRLPGAV